MTLRRDFFFNLLFTEWETEAQSQWWLLEVTQLVSGISGLEPKSFINPSHVLSKQVSQALKGNCWSLTWIALTPLVRLYPCLRGTFICHPPDCWDVLIHSGSVFTLAMAVSISILPCKSKQTIFQGETTWSEWEQGGMQNPQACLAGWNGDLGASDRLPISRTRYKY